jgi:DNA-directed RNA polymerase subunit beta'
VATDLRKHGGQVVVRSPMTCEAPEGICQRCQGEDEKGDLHPIGVNVGVRAANALSEPLTQFALNAKHGVRLLKGSSVKLEGIAGLRQLLEVPASFVNKATLAETPGLVTKITPAPHGGTYVNVGEGDHYVAPHLPVLVHEGEKVEAGDRLSEGIPSPAELVHYKGLGAGREYLVRTLHSLYRDANAGDIDKRHLELLARADLGHVRLLETSDRHPDLLRGDLIPYGRFRELAALETERLPVPRAEGHVLGEEVLHFTAGTEVTPSIVNTLQHHGVKDVLVSKSAPRVEFIMKPITRNPLLNPDWMARLAHRYLQDSLLRGAHEGHVSDLHGTHPVPAYAFGAEFGTGTEGHY